VVHVVDQGDWPCLRSFFEMGEERVDGGRKLLLPRGWFWVLQVQVPKLFGNGVQVARNGLVVWLRLVGVVVELGDEAHLKHNESVRKRPLLGAPTVGGINSGNTDQCIHVQGIRWVAHKTQGLYWFRYMVPYVQFEVDLSVFVCSVTGVLIIAMPRM